MKSKIFTTLLLVLIFSQVFSQQIPNSSFENWTVNTLYEEPDSFLTTNLQSYFTIGLGNVSRTTDSQQGTYAAHLQTIASTPNNITGGMFIGTPGDNGISGGYPYSQKPVALQGYLKYNIQPGDTAGIMVLLKRNGEFMAIAAINPVGTQSSYMQFTAPFTWIDTVSSHFPDTIVALVSSSNFNNAFAGSELYIDNITLTGVTQPFPNGDFENWTPNAVEDPDNWATINFIGIMTGEYSATKTTDYYGAGTYALKLETVIIPNESSADTMGFLTNGRLGDDGPRGGLKVDNYPKKVSGYYKYVPVGPDTALAALFLYGHDVFNNLLVLDSCMMVLPPTNTYTYFEMLLNYQGPVPADTLNITFASSNIKDSTNYIGAGSVLYLDELGIEYFPLSINEAVSNIGNVSLFPNPARDFIILNTSSENDFSEIRIFDLNGTQIRVNTFNNNKVDISEICNGIYVYQLISSDKIESGKLVICR